MLSSLISPEIESVCIQTQPTGLICVLLFYVMGFINSGKHRQLFTQSLVPWNVLFNQPCSQLVGLIKI